MKSPKKQDAKQKASQTYEEVATHLLNRFAKEFGLKFVEGKQKIPGAITEWEIDAKGVVGDEGFSSWSAAVIQRESRTNERWVNWRSV